MSIKVSKYFIILNMRHSKKEAFYNYLLWHLLQCRNVFFMLISFIHFLINSIYLSFLPYVVCPELFVLAP